MTHRLLDDEQVMVGVGTSAMTAIERARTTSTKLVVYIDGQIVEMTPEEYEVYLRHIKK